MKPRVRSLMWRDVKSGTESRHWHVEFQDSCGCREEVDFPNFTLALGFARHVALGGSRWEFVA